MTTKITQAFAAVAIVGVFAIIAGISHFSPLSFFIDSQDNAAASFLSRASDYIIYNGETATLLTSSDRQCLTYGQEVNEGRNSAKALKLTPDAWHAGGYSVNCGGQDRLDLSNYSYFEFYIKGSPSQTEGNHDFNMVSYYGTSNTVNLLKYVDGGVIDGSWRLVSIPMSDLKTTSYNLNSIDTIYFGADSANRVFYVDDIAARKIKSLPAAVVPTTPITTTPATQPTPGTHFRCNSDSQSNHPNSASRYAGDHYHITNASSHYSNNFGNTTCSHSINHISDNHSNPSENS